jgi:hypothetical protein
VWARDILSVIVSRLSPPLIVVPIGKSRGQPDLAGSPAPTGRFAAA